MQLFIQCFDVGHEIIIAALIYIERIFSTSHNGINFNEDNAKCFVHVAMAIASKFYEDRFEKGTIFYAVGGLSKTQMRSMVNYFLE